jgi:hypothetical protein
LQPRVLLFLQQQVSVVLQHLSAPVVDVLQVSAVVQRRLLLQVAR